MKKIFSVNLLVLLSAVLMIRGQEIVYNKQAKLSKNAGRVLKLKVICRIQDNPGVFVFRWPRKYKIGPDGSIYVAVGQAALYRFSPQGEYLGNLVAKGQGPGELGSLYSYFPQMKSVIQFDHYTSKVLIKNFSGKTQKEFKIPAKGTNYLMDVVGDTFYFRTLSPEESGKRPTSGAGVITWYYRYFHWNKGSPEPVATEVSFPRKIFMAAIKQGILSTGINRLIFSRIKNGHQFFSFNQRYQIHKFDLKSGKLVLNFTRPYKPVKFIRSPLPKNFKPIPGFEKRPKRKFHDDIKKLIINQDNSLWVLTSTVKRKGILVDVFALNGRYLDYFYLPLKADTKDRRRKRLTISTLPYFSICGDKVIVKETDEDDETVLVVYQIGK